MIPTAADERRGTWLPLGAGVLLVALRPVLPRPMAVAVAVVVLLGVGALVSGNLRRTAVLASVPSLAAGLVTGATRSIGWAAVVLISLPLVVAFTALLVKGGSLLVLQADPASPTTPNGSRPRPNGAASS